MMWNYNFLENSCSFIYPDNQQLYCIQQLAMESQPVLQLYILSKQIYLFVTKNVAIQTWYYHKKAIGTIYTYIELGMYYYAFNFTYVFESIL